MASQHNLGALLMPQFNPAPPSGFDPAKKPAGFTLSNNNLTVTLASGSGAAGSVTTHNSGKRYAETKTTSSNFRAFAVALASYDWTVSTRPGIGTDSWAYNSTGATEHNSSSIAHTSNAVSSNEVARIAIDIDAGALWFGDSVGWSSGGDPAAGTTPNYTISASVAYAIGLGLFNLPGDVGTFNGGLTAFAYSVPSGFIGWDL